MSVVTRTNRCTNPNFETNAAGYSAVNEATFARFASTAMSGAWVGRISFTGATVMDSGIVFSGVFAPAASTTYTVSMDVLSSAARSMKFSAQGTGVVNQTSAGVALSAGVKTRISWTFQTTATAPAGISTYLLRNDLITGTLDIDEVLIEVGSTAGTPFDGSYVNANSVMYAWTGAANASSSTAITYTPALALVAFPLFDPTPRVEITLTDMSPTTNSVTIWRTADGKRQAVRSFRKKDVVSSDAVVDFEAPLGRTVTYAVEVLSGIMANATSPLATTQVNAASGAIQDPLVPGGSVPVYGGVGPNGKAYLRDQALKDLEYAIESSIIPILGSPDPVAILGQRMSARGVDISMSTRAAQAAADLRNLLKSAGLVLVRPLPQWAGALPGLCYMAIGSPHEQPVDEAWGGVLIRWGLVGDLVAAPTMNVLVPLWTYGDVKALWNTYQQAQTALSGKTYLEVLKRPAGS